MSIIEALVAIQRELKAPKDQNAGRYRYRNIEDINEAVKPIAAQHGCAVVYSDRFEDGVCISTCRLVGGDGEIAADGAAYINRQPKNMSIEQASGSASSYARKYAACGLFAIDSSENDPDKVNAAKPKTGSAQKKRLWASIQRYAELRGEDPQAILDGLMASKSWRNDPGYWDAKAAEYERWCDEQRA